MYATTNSKHYAGTPNESLTCEWMNETLDMQQEYAKLSSLKKKKNPFNNNNKKKKKKSYDAEYFVLEIVSGLFLWTAVSVWLYGSVST